MPRSYTCPSLGFAPLSSVAEVLLPTDHGSGFLIAAPAHPPTGVDVAFTLDLSVPPHLPVNDK